MLKQLLRIHCERETIFKPFKLQLLQLHSCTSWHTVYQQARSIRATTRYRTTMHNIVWLDRSAIQIPVRRPRIENYEWSEYQTCPPSEIASRLKSATIAITNRARITREILEACPQLRYVAVCGTGYDCVDVEACKEKGVAVSNVRGWAVSVPEHVFALILALRRQLLEYRHAVNSGAWGAGPTYHMLLKPIPHALSGSILGIVGYGALAKGVLKIAEGFDMKVIIAERKDALDVRPGRARFEDVLKESDVLVMLCPLTEETRNLISTDELNTMKKSALLINSARGGVVDETALATAVKAGVISGTATDVLTNEPPKDGNPLVDAQLPNIIVTPHVAWASEGSLNNLAEQLIGCVEAYAEGRPKNLVT